MVRIATAQEIMPDGVDYHGTVRKGTLSAMFKNLEELVENGPRVQECENRLRHQLHVFLQTEPDFFCLFRPVSPQFQKLVDDELNKPTQRGKQVTGGWKGEHILPGGTNFGKEGVRKGQFGAFLVNYRSFLDNPQDEQVRKALESDVHSFESRLTFFRWLEPNDPRVKRMLDDYRMSVASRPVSKL
eukprot:NODE_4203_length_805_cov_210.867257_g4180_i0.p1 GENE.NODE_4203_length_805_cov_210.867257_g4180_i0~~NODE_4203_length_805_cov_210.867257_g4180_i0.p1  ORF type:complete len:186 (-),score=39.16 NODE_4203_length_805_cov_210.867257_g4180_i0:190-747(-)